MSITRAKAKVQNKSKFKLGHSVLTAGTSSLEPTGPDSQWRNTNRSLEVEGSLMEPIEEGKEDSQPKSPWTNQRVELQPSPLSLGSQTPDSHQQASLSRAWFSNPFPDLRLGCTKARSGSFVEQPNVLALTHSNGRGTQAAMTQGQETNMQDLS
jgi:hypothetical protein